MVYQVPKQYYFKIHHVRPRFKSNIESVLSYLAKGIVSIGVKNEHDFKTELNKYIRYFPGNNKKKIKTINNWRTEISSLFGFFYNDNKGNVHPGKIAWLLSIDNDLSEMFKHFLFKFQYPGAHVKDKYICEEIKHKIKFVPARHILKVLKSAQNCMQNQRYLTTEEVTWCMFNDNRVTKINHEPYQKTWDRIKKNRDNNVIYDSTGDNIRYAKDILDYMVMANLLDNHHNKYYFKLTEIDTIRKFLDNHKSFTEYDSYIKKGTIDLKDLKDKRISWFKYVNNIDTKYFKTDIFKYFNTTFEKYKSVQDTMNQLMRDSQEKYGIYHNTKEIGDHGEEIVYKYETDFMDLRSCPELKHLIKPIPTQFAVGYDINSIEPSHEELRRYIEVKSTISTKPLKIESFHMTPNEIRTAKTVGQHYFIYRLQILKNKNPKILKIRNPMGLIQEGKLSIINGEKKSKSGWEITINDLKNFKEITV